MTNNIKAAGGFAVLFIVFLFGAGTMFNSSWPWPRRLFAGVALMGPFALACWQLVVELLKDPRS